MRIKKKENIDIDADFPRVIHNSCTNQVNYYDNAYSHISFPCLESFNSKFHKINKYKLLNSVNILIDSFKIENFFRLILFILI